MPINYDSTSQVTATSNTMPMNSYELFADFCARSVNIFTSLCGPYSTGLLDIIRLQHVLHCRHCFWISSTCIRNENGHRVVAYLCFLFTWSLKTYKCYFETITRTIKNDSDTDLSVNCSCNPTKEFQDGDDPCCCAHAKYMLAYGTLVTVIKDTLSGYKNYSWKYFGTPILHTVNNQSVQLLAPANSIQTNIKYPLIFSTYDV